MNQYRTYDSDAETMTNFCFDDRKVRLQNRRKCFVFHRLGSLKKPNATVLNVWPARNEDPPFEVIVLRLNVFEARMMKRALGNMTYTAERDKRPWRRGQQKMTREEERRSANLAFTNEEVLVEMDHRGFRPATYGETTTSHGMETNSWEDLLEDDLLEFGDISDRHETRRLEDGYHWLDYVDVQTAHQEFSATETAEPKKMRRIPGNRGFREVEGEDEVA